MPVKGTALYQPQSALFQNKPHSTGRIAKLRNGSQSRDPPSTTPDNGSYCSHCPYCATVGGSSSYHLYSTGRGALFGGAPGRPAESLS